MTKPTRVREELWKAVCAANIYEGSVLVEPHRSEQRFRIRTNGDTSRRVVDMEGLLLIQEAV